MHAEQPSGGKNRSEKMCFRSGDWKWVKHIKSTVTSESLSHSKKELSLKLSSWFLIRFSWQLTHNLALLRTEVMQFFITEAIL